MAGDEDIPEKEAVLWQIEVANFLRLYPPFFLLTLAMVGNTLSIVVLSRPSIATTSVSVYLRVIAVFDTVVVICGYLPAILGTWANLDIIAITSETCRAHRFFLFFSGDVAVWLLALLTLDRLIVVMVPLKAKTWCRRRRASLVSIFFIGIAILKNTPIFFSLYLQETLTNETTNDPIYNSTKTVLVISRSCVVDDSFAYYEYVVRPWISLVFYYLITAIAILVSNFLILWKMSRRMKKFAGGGMKATGGQATTDGEAVEKNKDTSGSGQSRSLTLMIVSITVLFMILVTPSISIWTVMSQTIAVTDEDRAIRGLLFAITDVLVFGHHSINFILYVISGRRFRMELLYLIGCGGESKKSGMVSTLSTLNRKKPDV